MSNRNQLTRKALSKAMRAVWRAVWREALRRAKQDRVPEVNSAHEIIGMLSEVQRNFEDSVFNNESKEAQKEKLQAMGFVIILAAASIESESTDW